MEPDFDKEIDALLRDAGRNMPARSESVDAGHLGPDELVSFAENALPAASKPIYTNHLADCGKCRRMLADIIMLNDQAAPAAAVVQSYARKAEPWYRSFFRLPQLAAAMGALVLVFSGILGYVLFQRTETAQNTQLTQIAENEQRASGPMSVEPDHLLNSNSALVANAASNAVTVAANAANGSSNVSSETAAGAAVPKPTANSADAAKPVILDRTEVAAMSAEESKVEKQADLARRAEPMAAAAPPPPTEAGAAQKKAPARGVNSENLPMLERSAGRADKEGPNVRIIDGKTFERRSGSWYDQSYRNQPLTTVRRGTDGYIRLDAGLRSIADSLEGTVVIVWKERAYRIQ